ncbi:PREDICTED: cytokine-like protein 1 [Cyprinodon variegatus]|uniref:Zmp:0000001268 n=1 Tax=Cyprinodon variegatus TaxID=28743 RepID=A0A3Q2DQZ1_CYPVA|nr:PREDICTED: cytokine-like protein 1 [Cyprinodon variegatus]
MSILKKLLLVLSVVPMAVNYPFFPPTCYSKALSMAAELSQMAADLKIGYETGHCMAHMPDLYLDIHNACVMHKIRDYISMVEHLRLRRCAYTKEVRKLEVTLRQLFIILGQKCHGDLVFTIYDCAALERPYYPYYPY